MKASLDNFVIVMITDRIGLHSVLLPLRIRWHEDLLPINQNRYNFRENKCVLFRPFKTKREINISGGDPV